MRGVMIAALIATAACATGGNPARPGTAAPAEVAPADVSARIVAHLAKRLGIDPQALTVERIDDVTWATAALGCPEPGKMYAQVTTPGWRIMVRAPEAVRYEVHSNRDGSRWLICQAGRRLPVSGGARR